MGSSQSSSFSHIHHLCSKMTWLTSFLSYLNYLFTFTQTGHWRGHAQGHLVSAPSDLLFWIIFGLENSIVIWNVHLFITIHNHCFLHYKLKSCSQFQVSQCNVSSKCLGAGALNILNETHFLQLQNLNGPLSRLLISASPSLLTFHWLTDTSPSFINQHSGQNRSPYIVHNISPCRAAHNWHLRHTKKEQDYRTSCSDSEQHLVR